jgi:hypothetical protein
MNKWQKSRQMARVVCFGFFVGSVVFSFLVGLMGWVWRHL